MFGKSGQGALCNRCGDFEIFTIIDFKEHEETYGRKFKKKLLPKGWQIIQENRTIKVYCPKCLRIDKLKRILKNES